MADSTVVSFPAYGELTQTQGWARAANQPVRPDELDTAPTLGHDPTAPVEDPALRRYTEGKLLGVGGMGKVILAHDARVGREVAVKQLHADRELTDEERARFLREARVQGQLEHPAIVPVYDIDERADGSTFFTMRRVLGRTLHAILEELRTGDAAVRVRYSERELLTAFATVCLAIDYAHSRGVIHRDLKPANLMLGDFGEVYVLDWGLARLLDESETATAEEPASRLSRPGAMMGTPLYMAPEQMGSSDVGVAADVFALGAILFECLTLVRLRDAASMYTPAEARPSVRAPEQRVAPELETICVRATQSDASARYPTARALQEAVVRYLEGDRELAQRRELAAQHGKAARIALERAAADDAAYERERGIAMQELLRALALEPTSTEHVATLAQLMATPPRVVPEAVREELIAAEFQVVRSGAKHTTMASLTWFAFLPIALLIGIQSPLDAGIVLVPTAVGVGLAWWGSRRLRMGPAAQLAVFGVSLVAASATSAMYGSFLLMPTLIATLTIVIQTHPRPVMRRVTLAMGVIAMVVPIGLELAGVTHSYEFHDGVITIVPRLLALPRVPTVTLLLVANVLTMVVPCLFIARLRAALTELQQELLVRAWHFRRLGADLLGAKGRR